MIFLLHFDSNIDVILFIIQMIGCISFATSGAITALRKKVDILGVWILTLIGIFGGGLLRDLIINNGPPHIFWDSQYLILALAAIIISTIWFFIAYYKKTVFIIDIHAHDLWIYVIDALGTAIFCIYGVKEAYNAIPVDASLFGKYVFVISLGVISGVGGRMFRDVFIGEIPIIFKKHFYITPSIIGSTIYAILYSLNINDIFSICISIGSVVVLRSLASIYRWNLPSAKAYNMLLDEKEKKI